MESLNDQLYEKARAVSARLKRKPLRVVRGADLNSFSIFSDVPAADRAEFLKIAMEHPECSRAIGSMVGMAVCDSVGHAFEFLPVGEQGSRFDQETLEVTGDYNEINQVPSSSGGWGKFKLKRGQWTDDTAMGLCNADSLLARERYDGSDIRVRFWNWWNCGYNNAFRFDSSRSKSVGLGGNIALSLEDVGSRSSKKMEITPRFEAHGQDAGNGSLMRLTPIPLYFHSDLKLATEWSRESSFTTHPGPIAAEACAFLAYVIVRATKRSNVESLRASAFLDQCVKEYLARSKASMQPELVRLLRAKEPSTSTELCWNWRESDYAKLLRDSVVLRGKEYNGYPVSSGYFGSYSMDGLAMAMNAFYNTSSFMEALSRIVNFRGDSDSTGSICGQIAGAFYGIYSIDTRLIDQLQMWDNGEIALRGALLYALGANLSDSGKVKPKRVLSDVVSITELMYPSSNKVQKRATLESAVQKRPAPNDEGQASSSLSSTGIVKKRPASTHVKPRSSSSSVGKKPASTNAVLKRPAARDVKPSSFSKAAQTSASRTSAVKKRPASVHVSRVLSSIALQKRPASKSLVQKRPAAMPSSSSSTVKKRPASRSLVQKRLAAMPSSSSSTIKKRPASKSVERYVKKDLKRPSSSSKILKRPASKIRAQKRLAVDAVRRPSFKKVLRKPAATLSRRPALKQVKKRPSSIIHKLNVSKTSVANRGVKRRPSSIITRKSSGSQSKKKQASKGALGNLKRRPSIDESLKKPASDGVFKREVLQTLALRVLERLATEE
jgi:ADP-ribosylglycohydrolase|mmetsp:Transcript_55995/g.87133  ORF Transcript_55995/g.87133 Transcript_55995/m.87133 type:complete len:779 (+) Transcript_55995:64-2400(+)|eukprot:CAMPEP_0169099266 /NCGR_PEP_ID=MMETSP1015-20121227/20469_1 /TAXON_ID=342587 /ORGANISM="Karlodinium micrum, Strain CCMP2283" /LENGTH=778 /DNA_ID=CAMNT_0009160143 /DNA_START=74 /DNA_END=2410 /DNA_ORIENTATION=-